MKNLNGETIKCLTEPKNNWMDLPRDVVLPPPLTPTIMITAGFLVQRTCQKLITEFSKSTQDKVFRTSSNLKPSCNSVLSLFAVSKFNMLFFKASYKPPRLVSFNLVVNLHENTLT